jgi:hypothetical protein
MNAADPGLGTDDCEGHVYFWTCPARESDRRLSDLPVHSADGATERASRQQPASNPVVRAAGSKGKRRHWWKLSD